MEGVRRRCLPRGQWRQLARLPRRAPQGPEREAVLREQAQVAAQRQGTLTSQARTVPMLREATQRTPQVAVALAMRPLQAAPQPQGLGQLPLQSASEFFFQPDLLGL